MSKLIEQLKRHEGFRGQPYKCPAGVTTIGYGHNLDAHPLTEEQATAILEEDVRNVEEELYQRYPHYKFFREPRRDALINLLFNIGMTSFRRFSQMHNALLHGEFSEAAYHMKDSRWYKQVGNRGEELVRQMASGEYQ